MNRAPTLAHWIKPNESTRLPRRHICLDTEAHQREIPGGRQQTFRLAVAQFDWQNRKGADWSTTGPQRFTSTKDLWDWVHGCTAPARRTVVVAHNLAYDLRIADAFAHLPRLGYHVDMIRLDGGSCWCVWRNGTRTLSMVDTVSWFGTSLERVGNLLGMTKPHLPDFNGSDEAWFARCEADVKILRAAWLTVLRWIEADDLGNWKPTGAGQGWAAYRHRHMTHPVLHHANPRIAALEREAAYAGRCEAWRHGRLPRGVWTEWDFSCAYTRVARDFAVPVRLRGHVGGRSADRHLRDGGDGATLVRARVDQCAPVLPARGRHGICWPIGQLTGWWWDCELREARAHGAQVECLEGWRYDTAPALAQWACWVLDLLDQPQTIDNAIQRLVVKQWSRTVVGRFGSRWSTWLPEGESHGEQVALRVELDGDASTSRRMMVVGNQTMVEGEASDAEDGAVHVMSYVMAQCRVNLWRAMQTAGVNNVAYVDTDSVLVNEVGSARLAAAAIPGLRVKSRWSGVDVYGPRQLVLRGELRAAGIPRSAVSIGGRRWSAEVWRSLPASLRAGEADRVVLRDRAFTLHGTDHRRAHEANGLTAPYLASDAL